METSSALSTGFHDITERKQSEEYAKILSRELDHRAKNLLTLVL